MRWPAASGSLVAVLATTLVYGPFGSDRVVEADAGTPPPRARTTEAIGVHRFEAVLTGVIEARSEPTRLKFQYGRTKSYGVTTEASEQVVSGNRKREKVAAAAFDLRPGTTYHYRIVAFNRHGSARGQDRTFTTTGPAV